MRTLIILLLSACTLCAQESLYSIAFTNFTKVQGTWKRTTPRGVYYEQWQRVSHDSLTGRSYSVSASGDTILQETLVVHFDAKGLYYTPTVAKQNNNQPVRFTLRSSTSTTFVFENPTHDFPKRIGYDLSDVELLTAWIDGGAENAQKRMEFMFVKQ